MGERIRAFDWAATTLGPTSTWPQSLRSAVSILLPSKAQICLFWGPQLIKLYNDAYIPVLQRKHPGVLGRPAREVWSEIWDVLGPLLEGVIATGEAFRATDHPFYLERRGFAEETYFDVSYDPVRDETGRVGGVFCIVSETTGRVLGERRLRTLRDLGRAKEAVGNRGVSPGARRARAPSSGHPLRATPPARARRERRAGHLRRRDLHERRVRCGRRRPGRPSLALRPGGRHRSADRAGRDAGDLRN
jgi:PAS fold